jgi:hypothetical protein
MNIEPINFANIELVEIKNGTPHCLKHGAMNKMNVHEDGGGIWRCLSAVSKQNDTACRAGCCEKRPNLGICLVCERKPAVKDYNGHKYYVCEGCYESLEREFENEYN